jgi:GNAT acetyltransferase-like protein
MNYQLLKKKLSVPADFVPPTQLAYDDLVGTAITRSDLDDDVRGINASLELIRRTRGGPWPSEPVTLEYNFVDLVWHELEFREGYSFTYVLRAAKGGYLGCCYLYPMGERTELTEELLRYDVDVSWWVTPSAYDAGYYKKAYCALRHWLATEYPFREVYYSNREIPDES